MSRILVAEDEPGISSFVMKGSPLPATPPRLSRTG